MIISISCVNSVMGRDGQYAIKMPMRSMFVVAAVLASVIVVDIESNQTPDTKVMYYVRSDTLYRMNPLSPNEEPLGNNVLDFQLNGNAQPVWMDHSARIYKSGDELVLRYKLSVDKAKFALDHLTNKFYIVEGDSQEISVLQPDFKRAVLFERSPIGDKYIVPEKTKMIAMDPDDGLMFMLTDFNGIKKVYRIDMDGTGKRKIVEDLTTDELSIDVQSRKIYWFNNKGRFVENVDYEGTQRRTIDGLSGVTNNTTIAVLDEEIYWFDGAGQINICKLRENACDKSTLRHLKLPSSTQPIKYLKLSSNSTPKNTSSTNACHPDNGGCQHMCLLNSRGGRSCVCYAGWEANGKKCKLRRPKRQMWDLYMTPQPTLRPEPQPVDMSGLPIQTSIFGK